MLTSKPMGRGEAATILVKMFGSSEKHAQGLLVEADMDPGEWKGNDIVAVKRHGPADWYYVRYSWENLAAYQPVGLARH
jgi:hypothetical protein